MGKNWTCRITALTRFPDPPWLPTRPKNVIRRSFKISAVRVIRFTERIAGQCARGGGPGPDRVVCDAIANGTRLPTGRRGRLGGAIVLFEKAFPGNGNGASGTRVAVLCEVTRRGHFALGLKPGVRPERIWAELGFLNRAHSK
jgi:hypothetical protein